MLAQQASDRRDSAGNGTVAKPCRLRVVSARGATTCGTIVAPSMAAKRPSALRTTSCTRPPRLALAGSVTISASAAAAAPSTAFPPSANMARPAAAAWTDPDETTANRPRATFSPTTGCAPSPLAVTVASTQRQRAAHALCDRGNAPGHRHVAHGCNQLTMRSAPSSTRRQCVCRNAWSTTRSSARAMASSAAAPSKST